MIEISFNYSSACSYITPENLTSAFGDGGNDLAYFTRVTVALGID